MLVFCTTERYSHAEFIIIHSGAWMGCRIEATPLTITDILLNDYCITCNMYVHRVEAANFVRFWMRLQFTYLQLHTWLCRIRYNVSVPVLFLSTSFVSRFVIG